MTGNGLKPNTHQRNLAKLPPALAPLIERTQWCVWRWTQKPDGSWQKPPFMATQPERHASTNDPDTWTDHPTTLAAVQAGHADGISYILTKDDPFGAIDLDHCRNTLTCSIDVWAQNFMQAAVNSYQEVTPSGAGVRVWGLANGAELHRKFMLEIDGKPIAAELFRRTNKALTVTGYTLDPAIHELANIDKVFNWAVVWGDRRKAVAATARVNDGNGSAGGDRCPYTIDQIEHIVRGGHPEGTDRSAVFHSIVGHYLGCGWDEQRILAHLQQYPQGISGRYLREDRLHQEILRSAGKYAKPELPLSSGNGGWTGREAKAPPWPEQHQEPPPEEGPDDVDPELEDDDDEDDLDEEEQDPKLPRLYAHR